MRWYWKPHLLRPCELHILAAKSNLWLFVPVILIFTSTFLLREPGTLCFPYWDSLSHLCTQTLPLLQAQVPPSTQPSPISTLGILSTHRCSYALAVTHNWVFPLTPAGQMAFVGLCHQLHLVRPA